jgi:hypothetical protein
MLLAPLLDGCATDVAYAPAPISGPTVVSVVGTPFLLAFKIPACAATLAIGAPLAGLTGLADPYRFAPSAVRVELDHAVTQNCGPPWILPP